MTKAKRHEDGRGKIDLRRPVGENLEAIADAYRYATEVMTDNMMARDAEEGICAFIEKREPIWRDE